MNRLALVICLPLALTACGCSNLNLEESIGVGADDNAIMCIRASLDGYFTDSRADYTRLEMPEGFDVNTLDAEGLRALTELAARLGC